MANNVSFVNGGSYSPSTTNATTVQGFLRENGINNLAATQQLTVNGAVVSYAAAASHYITNNMSIVVTAKTAANLRTTISYVHGGSYTPVEVDVATVGEFLRNQGVTRLAATEQITVNGAVYTSLSSVQEIAVTPHMSIVVTAKTAANK